MRSVSSLVLVAMSGAAQAACPGQTQMEMNDCAVADYQRADAQLNEAWGNAIVFMDRAGHGEILLDAQRKWVAFRDAACAAEAAPYTGGSIQPLIYYSCATRLTTARTQDLEGFRF